VTYASAGCVRTARYLHHSAATAKMLSEERFDGTILRERVSAQI